jgi:probable O-glycosylation ligase (exosortase A-associated)
MRDYLLFVIIIGLIPVILMRPWVGILAWFWVGLMAPHSLTWGFMRSFPVAMVIVAATLVALLADKDKRPLPKSRLMGLLFLWVGWITLTTALAVNPNAWGYWVHFMKIILITFIAPLLIFGPGRIIAMLLVITGSLAFYGFKGGLFAASTGGAHMVLGPTGSYLAGNTYIGLAMIMVLPAILVTARLFHRRWVEFDWAIVRRHSRLLGLCGYAVFWLTVIAILATYSRGALLGLLVIAPFLFLRMQRKALLVALAVIVFGVIGVTAPERLVERWSTIESYEEDRSAMQRIQAWGVNWNMALDRPLVGMGFRNGGMGYDWWIQYAEFEGDWTHVLSPHSIYFSVLGQHGFVGLGIYLALIAGTLLVLNRIRREAARERPDRIWLAEYAWALQVGLLGYLAAGAFLDVAYFDLLYAFIALAVVMQRELEQGTVQAGSSARNARHGGALQPGFRDFVVRGEPGGGDRV